LENKTIQITDLEQFINAICDLGKYKNNIINNDVLFFRGNKTTCEKLLPTIARQSEEIIDNSPVVLENYLINEAKRKRPDIFTEETYPINLLTKMQHFGMKTRLLDVTTNALVALYFACENSKKSDGEVIVFKIKSDCIQSNSSPTANAIALTYNVSQFTHSSFDDFVYLVEKQDFFNNTFFNYDYSLSKKRFINRNEFIKEFKRIVDYPQFVFPLELS